MRSRSDRAATHIAFNLLESAYWAACIGTDAHKLDVMVAFPTLLAENLDATLFSLYKIVTTLRGVFVCVWSRQKITGIARIPSIAHALPRPGPPKALHAFDF